MNKNGKLIIFTILFLVLASYVQAVSITNLSIIDKLNADLSMRETIIIYIENNAEKEFKLALPEGSYDIIVNGLAFEDLSVSDDIACDNCSAKISYSFVGIVKNDSGNYTFYRKIDFPINVSFLSYSIILPENHSLFNISDLRTSILTNPSTIIDNRTFEWQYENPEFPAEFAVRYIGNNLIKSQIDKMQIDYSSIILISITTFFSLFLIAILLMFVKKKR